ncbi:MAG: hypothetical protein LUE87_04210 [Lachnospiraceae bacterium]|nr:hypothetical protein [Lachnospiraceae bacterium]
MAIFSGKTKADNGDRWVSFRCGVSLYNKVFDEKILSDTNRFNKAYIEEFNRDKGMPQNNIVILNFQTQNLKELKICI